MIGVSQDTTLYAIWDENITATLSVSNNKIVENSQMTMGANATTGVQKVELKVGNNVLFIEDTIGGSKEYTKNNLAVENLNQTAFENLPFYEIGLEVWVTSVAGNTKSQTFACKNYTIGNSEALEKFAEVVNGGTNLSGETIYLQKDLSVGTHTSIGTWDGSEGTLTKSNCFRGTFEGNSHTITIYKYVSTSTVGLFGSTYGARVQNITVLDKTLSQGSNIARRSG